jgi:hypothetical protein
MINFFYQFSIPVQESIIQKILPTSISGLIVLFVFFLGRFFDSRRRLKEIRSQWYLSIIILPNLPRIESFIKALCIHINTSVNDLRNVDVATSPEDYLIRKSVKIGEFQTIKREFELDFVYLVGMHYPEIAEDLSQQFQDIEDNVTKTFDQSGSTDERMDIDGMIKLFRNNLLAILYKPLSHKSRRS